MPEPHPYTVASARAAAERDELTAWVVDFLASPGSDNAPLGEKLSASHPFWTGPVEVPLDDLNRLAGPPGTPALVEVDDDSWRGDVDELAKLVAEEELEPPPVIASYQDGRLILEDGNHRVEALRRAGQPTAWTVIGFEDAAAQHEFVAAGSSHH